jgi:hypothetical protein
MVRKYITYAPSGAYMWFGRHYKLVIIKFIVLVLSFENVAKLKYLRMTLTYRKVKLSLYLIKHHATKTYGGVMV